MSKKIIVICKEFKNDWRGTDVDSRFYDEDMNPIMATRFYGGIEDTYHLGQISSSFMWAMQDCGYERYKTDFDRLYPEQNGDFIFDYQLIKI